jgi:ATP adenylyltransferase
LQHKSAPKSQVDATDDAAQAIATGGNESEVYDPFAPPYNIDLHVGDLKDEESQEEFVVLVRKVVRPKCLTDFHSFLIFS